MKLRKPKNNIRQTLALYWQHVRPHWRLGLPLIICIIIGSIVSTLVPIYYKRFFDELTRPGITRAALIDTIVIIAWIQAVQWIFWRAAGLINNRFQPRVIQDLLQTCLTYLHRHSFSFFNSNYVGSLIKRVNRFADAFENLADNVTWYLLKLFLNMAVILIVLFSREAKLALAVIVWIMLYLVINWILTNYKFKHDQAHTAAETRVTGLLADTITNHSNVKLFNGSAREANGFLNATGEARRLRTYTWDLDAIFEGFQTALMVGLELLMFVLAIRLWQEKTLTVGDFVLIQAYLLTIFEQVWNLGRTVRHMYERMAEAGEMTDILLTPHEIRDARRALALVVTAGRIDFERVSFCYHETRPIIKKLSLAIKSKEKIAMVGPSGAGKSTLIRLIMRAHDAAAGKILIDGQNIERVTQESLWQNIGFVPQEPLLFHRSLMENIRYGQPSASDEEVIEAAKLARCHEFIMELQDGYGTFVGERGVKLSGGERQRVAIARAILRNAPLLLLDEATSSLDSESERFIQSALTELMKNKTVIVVAHRLSTIMKMDRIVVIDRGEIIESGTHQELLKKTAGMYRKLWELQVGGFLQ